MDQAPPKRRTPWRDNLEAAVMAVVMALFLKVFVVEAYKIPTGSMQPTLIGDADTGLQDRILVDKLSYQVRSPARFEVVVFRFPLDRAKTFVKRVVGVGPEDLEIRFGDLWHRPPNEDWRVLRRPRDVQQVHWKRLDLEEPEETRWRIERESPGAEWSLDGRSLTARGDGTMVFRSASTSILDAYLDGYPEEVAALMPAGHPNASRRSVADLRVDGEIEALPGLRALHLVLKEGRQTYRFTLPGPGAPEEAAPTIDPGRVLEVTENGTARRGSPWRLPAGESLRFAAQNLDDLLELEVNGEVVLSLEIPSTGPDQGSNLWLELEGEGATLSDLMVYRDIYYTNESSGVVRIPEGEYYVLGDNTQDSSDSREWRYANLHLAPVDGEQRILRGYARDRENPLIQGFGDADGPRYHLIDEWGESHWIPHDQVRRRTSEPAPFVPRAAIQGRALAVFWPLDPVHSIYRFGWIR